MLKLEILMNYLIFFSDSSSGSSSDENEAESSENEAETSSEYESEDNIPLSELKKRL